MVTHRGSTPTRISSTTDMLVVSTKDSEFESGLTTSSIIPSEVKAIPELDLLICEGSSSWGGEIVLEMSTKATITIIRMNIPVRFNRLFISTFHPKIKILYAND